MFKLQVVWLSYCNNTRRHINKKWPQSRTLVHKICWFIRPGFFDQGCRESSALEVTKPGRPSFGGQGCQQSLAVAILARLRPHFPGKPGQKPEKPGLASLFQAGQVFGRAPDARAGFMLVLLFSFLLSFLSFFCLFYCVSFFVGCSVSRAHITWSQSFLFKDFQKFSD